ncbi:MAG: hypothetical protein HYY24_16740 [Verrucomicrobia bacterium]|nr:hypothetical protein [Verrucomicrobiota bacterium]
MKLTVLGALGVLLVAVLVVAAWLLNLIWWTIPFLQETGLLGWIGATALALAVTAALAGLRFRQAWRRSPTRTAPVWAMLAVSIALGGWLWHRSDVALHEFLPRVVKLNLPSLPGPVPTYHDHGAKARAERLQADIREMNSFYQEKLSVQAAVTLAVLNSNQWTRVNPIPFGLPGVLGEPPVIFAPAHSGGWAFRQMLARKEAIPADVLQDYLRTSQKTFEAASDDFVDFIALHELGHVLCIHYGIDPSCNWLNEFLASYFGYAFLAERRPERKPVIALFGRPSQTRPKHTTLADFERLYFLVDDYAWYQGMFERRIQEMYPQVGLQFIKDLKRGLPRTTGIPDGVSIPDPVVNRIPPEEALEKVEAIAPGFRAWAKGFRK